MHFDTRLLIVYFLSALSIDFVQSLSRDQIYQRFIEFHRGEKQTHLILSSPHAGFLGANLTDFNEKSTRVQEWRRLPTAGCYKNSFDRCFYTIHDCLKSPNDDDYSLTADARCLIDRSSSPTMYALTKSIFNSFTRNIRPYLILNKLTRQFVDPAEDLPLGTFLMEDSVRTYADYHRLISMAKEAIFSNRSSILMIEFVFHRKSSTIYLGYGYDPTQSFIKTRRIQSTVNDLILKFGSNVVLGNRSLSYFLKVHGFKRVLPWNQTVPVDARLSTYSTRFHSDPNCNTILFSYPIERLRTHSIRNEAQRIAKAIEDFMTVNQIQARLSSSSSSLFSTFDLVVCLFLHVIFS